MEFWFDLLSSATVEAVWVFNKLGRADEGSFFGISQSVGEQLMTNQSTLVADNHEDHGERSRTDAGSQALGMAPSTNKGARPAMLCLRELSSEPEANGGKCVVAVDGRSQIDGDQADAAKLKDYLLGYCVSLAPATPGMYKFGAALQ